VTYALIVFLGATGALIAYILRWGIGQADEASLAHGRRRAQEKIDEERVVEAVRQRDEALAALTVVRAELVDARKRLATAEQQRNRTYAEEREHVETIRDADAAVDSFNRILQNVPTRK
jgi:hypothetical protein